MVTYILAAQHGLGHHTDTLEKADYHEYLKMTFIQAIVSTIGGLLFLKLSVGFSLLRIGTPKLYARVLWALIGRNHDKTAFGKIAPKTCTGFVCLYSAVSWVEWALVCKPIAGFWNKDLKSKCIPTNVHKGFALMNTSMSLTTRYCRIFID